MEANVSELLQTLVSEIPARAKSEKATDWTEAAKQVLCGLGLKRMFKVFGSVHLDTENIKRREWMLDLVWYSSEKKGGIELAVESEWGKQEEILDDFEKLMSVKSPVKLLLFSSGGSEKRSEILRRLQDYLTDFEQHIDGETYLLLDFSAGTHECYTFSVRRNGRLHEKVRFHNERHLSGPDVKVLVAAS